MQVLRFKQFHKNLANTFTYTVENHAPVFVKHGDSRAILISLDNYNAKNKTDYLLSMPANIARLFPAYKPSKNSNLSKEI